MSVTTSHRTHDQAQKAKTASRELRRWTSAQKDALLRAMADSLEANAAFILKENQLDVEAGRAHGLSSAFIDRLTLSQKTIQSMAQGLRDIAGQKDPLGEVLAEWTRPNGMRIQQVRVPLGVIGIIYESRPNVTVDAASLCLKAGNAVILRGGKDAYRSSRALVEALLHAGTRHHLPEGSIQLLESTDRESIRELTQLPEFVDLIIARGSEEMIRDVSSKSLVPVLGHGKGVCHVYVDQAADLAMAEKIAYNAKVQRPGVCNAMETLLVHEKVAAKFLPMIGQAYQKAQVEIRGDDTVQKTISGSLPASESDWSTEYSALIVSIAVVPSLSAAIDHINRYGSGHSDAIVTTDVQAAKTFLSSVDSAAVFHNASTRLHDGSVFGLGAEIGISTKKLHARGTMGARELTATQYVVHGTGQIRE